MKSTTHRTLAIAAAVLLFSAAYAVAGENVHLEQTGGDRAERDLGVAAIPGNRAELGQDGGVIVDRNDDTPRGVGRFLQLRKPRFAPGSASQAKRIGNRICLVTPIPGQAVCWRG